MVGSFHDSEIPSSIISLFNNSACLLYQLTSASPEVFAPSGCLPLDIQPLDCRVRARPLPARAKCTIVGPTGQLRTPLKTQSSFSESC